VQTPLDQKIQRTRDVVSLLNIVMKSLAGEVAENFGACGGLGTSRRK